LSYTVAFSHKLPFRLLKVNTIENPLPVSQETAKTIFQVFNIPISLAPTCGTMQIKSMSIIIESSAREKCSFNK
jgi:hypothetical protein